MKIEAVGGPFCGELIEMPDRLGAEIISSDADIYRVEAWRAHEHPIRVIARHRPATDQDATGSP